MQTSGVHPLHWRHRPILYCFDSVQKLPDKPNRGNLHFLHIWMNCSRKIVTLRLFSVLYIFLIFDALWYPYFHSFFLFCLFCLHCLFYCGKSSSSTDSLRPAFIICFLGKNRVYWFGIKRSISTYSKFTAWNLKEYNFL